MIAKMPPFQRASADIHFRSNNSSSQSIRIMLLPLFVLALFMTFGARLFQLTIVKGAYYQFIANDNRIREVEIPGARGDILDRKGRVIAQSIAKNTLNPMIDRAIPTYTRVYDHEGASAHVLGYMRTISTKQLQEDACSELAGMRDKIGVDGVEGLFECHLRGHKGKVLVEVNSMGKAIKTLSQIDPRKGNNIRLSIDHSLQSSLYDALNENTIKVNATFPLKDKRIGVVAMKPQTGELLMLYSHPTFDPNDFENNTVATKDYFKNPDKPLFNRALLGTYPPGSVFKPIVAIGALEDKAIDERETIEDNGYIQAGPIRFHNWYYTKYGKTDSNVDVRKALQRSNDIYFYRVGEKLTPEKIKSWAHEFGLGKKSSIELPEAQGVVPSDFWKREVVGEKWFTGDTYNLSIGQGYLLTTPLQITRATAAIANNGTLCKPTILKTSEPDNKDIQTPPSCTNMPISAQSLSAVQDGMLQACQSGGTGWPFFSFTVNGNPVQVGCKTGTAEAHKAHTRPYAWFTIYAPYDKPEIALTVLVEDAGEGSEIAAPIAKHILTDYFSQTLSPKKEAPTASPSGTSEEILSE